MSWLFPLRISKSTVTNFAGAILTSTFVQFYIFTNTLSNKKIPNKKLNNNNNTTNNNNDQKPQQNILLLLLCTPYHICSVYVQLEWLQVISMQKKKKNTTPIIKTTLYSQLPLRTAPTERSSNIDERLSTTKNRTRSACLEVSHTWYYSKTRNLPRKIGISCS